MWKDRRVSSLRSAYATWIRTLGGATGGTHDGVVLTHDWLPLSGPVAVGLTAGASTPDSTLANVISRLALFCTADG